MRGLHKIALAAALLLLAGAASATPLGLQAGDVVTNLEWDALKSVSGDGGSFDSGSGVTAMDGRITSVSLQAGPTTNPLTGVNFTLDATLQSVSSTPLGGTLFLIVAEFGGVAGDDITLSDGTGTILTAELDPLAPLQIGGVFDTSNLTLTPSANVDAANIMITGGDPALQAALGGMATLEITGTITDFAPSLATLLGDGNLFNSSFTYSGSGNITPTNPAPFVPEPGVVALLGAGLAVGALARRGRG
jgi:hypothetical protein